MSEYHNTAVVSLWIAIPITVITIFILRDMNFFNGLSDLARGSIGFAVGLASSAIGNFVARRLD